MCLGSILLGFFFDKKFGFKIANFQKNLIFAKNNGFSKKNIRATVFKVEGCAFRFWSFTFKTRTLK